MRLWEYVLEVILKPSLEFHISIHDVELVT